MALKYLKVLLIKWDLLHIVLDFNFKHSGKYRILFWILTFLRLHPLNLKMQLPFPRIEEVTLSVHKSDLLTRRVEMKNPKCLKKNGKANAHRLVSSAAAPTTVVKANN
jgi:hypothetical protein